MTRMTILIVDDDEHMAAMMRVCLQRGGFRVLEADNGVDGLKLFEQFSPLANRKKLSLENQMPPSLPPLPPIPN